MAYCAASADVFYVSLLRRLTSIPLAARVLLLAACITGALTVVAAAREPTPTQLPAAPVGTGTASSSVPATEEVSNTPEVQLQLLLDEDEGAIPVPPADVQPPLEETRHANNSRFSMPLRVGFTVTDRFGAPRGNGFIHGGIDLALYGNAPVFAACDGTVGTAAYSSVYGYHVVVDCGGDYTTLYAHFSEIRVSPGQAVSPNHVLGLSGSTGFSTGEHLHFEVHWRGVHVNPEDYLDFKIPPGTPLSNGPIVWGNTTAGGGAASGGGGFPAGGSSSSGSSPAPGDQAPTDPTATEEPSATATTEPTATSTPLPPTATPTPEPTATPTPTPTPPPPTPTRTPTPRPVIR